MVVDHINGNPLDNRRANLRIVAQRENAQNIDRQRPGMRGVSLHKPTGKWHVQVYSGGTRHYGGLFVALDDAQRAARDLRAKVLTHHNEERA